MPARHRSNPLALAVLISLMERPMHPYEVATMLRGRRKDESVRLNYGSLYSVVSSLERRGLIVAQGTAREGRLPERTIYEITHTGRIEAHDWLSELLSTPTKEYPAFEAALSFLPVLPPEEAVALLEHRAASLELGLAQYRGARELVAQYKLPRLLWVEIEFAAAMRRAELDYTRQLIADILAGDLDGVEWWHRLHREDGPPPPPPNAGSWPELERRARH
jgi:DNA-binding PadR family transcriptional regulator